MATWGAFATDSPDLAAEGRRLFYRTDIGEVFLATVREGGPPRIHPIWISIVGDSLYAFILASAKRGDLRRDGRYAMHSHVDPAKPSEFSVRGSAKLVDDARVRADVGRQWYFEVDDTYELFEFSVDAAILGVRETADEWPPRYTTWRNSERG